MYILYTVSNLYEHLVVWSDLRGELECMLGPWRRDQTLSHPLGPPCLLKAYEGSLLELLTVEQKFAF